MTNKTEIVENWLPRYTGTALKDFGDYILLTNFQNYVKYFATTQNLYTSHTPFYFHFTPTLVES